MEVNGLAEEQIRTRGWKAAIGTLSRGEVCFRVIRCQVELEGNHGANCIIKFVRQWGIICAGDET